MPNSVKSLFDIEKQHRCVMLFVEVIRKKLSHAKKLVTRTMFLAETMLKVGKNLFRFGENRNPVENYCFGNFAQTAKKADRAKACRGGKGFPFFGNTDYGRLFPSGWKVVMTHHRIDDVG